LKIQFLCFVAPVEQANGGVATLQRFYKHFEIVAGHQRRGQAIEFPGIYSYTKKAMQVSIAGKITE
jgi:hypothetical protein